MVILKGRSAKLILLVIGIVMLIVIYNINLY